MMLINMDTVFAELSAILFLSLTFTLIEGSRLGASLQCWLP